MGRLRGLTWAIATASILAGCATVPPLDNPALVNPPVDSDVENPVYLPQGPGSYGKVFETVLSSVAEFFEIRYSNRYDGQIITFPRIAPGLFEPWKPGSPAFDERLLATFQTIRHRAEIRIDAAVEIVVARERRRAPFVGTDVEQCADGTRKTIEIHERC